jgi:hypothetical protein
VANDSSPKIKNDRSPKHQILPLIFWRTIVRRELHPRSPTVRQFVNYLFFSNYGERSANTGGVRRELALQTVRQKYL